MTDEVKTGKVPSWAWRLYAVLALVFLGGASVLSYSKPKQAAPAATGAVAPATVPTAAPIKTAAAPFASIPWEPGVPVVKLTEAVTCIEVKLNEWTVAYEVPPFARTQVFMPGNQFDWWFSTGEQIPNPVSRADSFGHLPSRTFRLRDRGASGQAVIYLHDN